MLVVMACTMAIAAPITMVVGVILALREDVGLSIVLVFAMPVAAIVLGMIVAHMVPAFRLMQERIDQVNRVLREQITGIRVVRAFVREPQEAKRFESANADLTEVSLRGGRLMSSMFPTVNLLINLSSVAVLWLGGREVNSGDIEVGIARRVPHLPRADPDVGRDGDVHGVDDPAGVGVGRPHPGGARHRIRASCRPPNPCASSPSPAPRVPTTSASATRAPSTRCSATSRSRPAGQTTAIVGSTGAGKTTLVNLILRLFDSTEGKVLVGGVDVRDLDPDVLWSTIGSCRSGRTCSRARWRATSSSASPTRPRKRCGRRSRSRRRPTSSPRCPAASTPASSRAAPTCRAGSASGCRSHARSSAGPTSTCSTTRSRRSTSPLTPASGPRSGRTRATPRSSSSPSGCRRSRPPTTSSCSRTARSSAAGRTTS